MVKIQIYSNIGKEGPHGPRRGVLIFYAVLSTELCTRDFASSLCSSPAPESSAMANAAAHDKKFTGYSVLARLRALPKQGNRISQKITD
jgi:hypothetical protein